MLEQILEIGKRWYYTEKLTKDEIKILRNEYRKHSGKTLGSCPSCYVEAYIFLKNLKTNKMEKEKSQFGIASGKQIQMHGLSEVITEHNLTDSLAFACLKQNAKAISLFTKYPADWEKQLAKFDPLVEARKKKTAKVEEEKEEEVTDPLNEEEKKHEQRLKYDAMTKLDLQSIASSEELPEDYWIKLNKKHLINYLLENIK